MRAYIKHDYGLDHPDDLEKIVAYLKEHGELLILPDTVETLYRRFSDERFSASWLTPAPDILETFADWLSDIDV